MGECIERAGGFRKTCMNNDAIPGYDIIVYIIVPLINLGDKIGYFRILTWETLY